MLHISFKNYIQFLMSELKTLDSIYFILFSYFYFLVHFIFLFLNLGLGVSIMSYVTVTQSHTERCRRFQNYITCLLHVYLIYNICSLEQARFSVASTISPVYIKQTLCTWNSIKFSCINLLQGSFFTLILELKL